jgi:hypothetical protein
VNALGRNPFLIPVTSIKEPHGIGKALAASRAGPKGLIEAGHEVQHHIETQELRRREMPISPNEKDVPNDDP